MKKKNKQTCDGRDFNAGGSFQPDGGVGFLCDDIDDPIGGGGNAELDGIAC